MNEKAIRFNSEKLELEGRWYAAGPKGVVVSHPHPLYGGSLDNVVVETVVRTFQELGFSTLRFNFRGVGSSQGAYDNGIGEADDTREALNYLTQIGIQQVYLAGYSFGAWVNAQLTPQEIGDTPMIMVSPPVAFMQFKDQLVLPHLKLVITGDLDEIAPKQMVREQLAGWNPSARFDVISGADHFYSGCLPNLAKSLKAANLSNF
jgi:alpha/beta superfamily hydrolase